MAATQPTHTLTAPWWVRSFTAAGRPVVAAVVLILCAPGEHHLGVLAGWNDHLAWGMAFVLAAYAGIAAAVATNRPTGTPGKTSAVLGAWLSLAAAMAAQPISHLFTTGVWTGTPAWLVVTVSCVPPLVLGHLLHLAATPPRRRGTPAGAPSPTGVTPAQTQATTPARATVPPMPDAPPALPVPAVDARPDAPLPYLADPRAVAIRRLYDTGTRPGTRQMQAAVHAATGDRLGDSTVRRLRLEVVEPHEPWLAELPAAIAA